MSNPRQRVEDTPSHPGGLSEESRVLLETYRRRRDHQRGAFNSIICAPSTLIRVRGNFGARKESGTPPWPR